MLHITGWCAILVGLCGGIRHADLMYSFAVPRRQRMHESVQSCQRPIFGDLQMVTEFERLHGSLPFPQRTFMLVRPVIVPHQGRQLG